VATAADHCSNLLNKKKMGIRPSSLSFRSPALDSHNASENTFVRATSVNYLIINNYFVRRNAKTRASDQYFEKKS
jgi:hypothetical protein